MSEKILDRFIKYVKVNTRSNASSTTIPSTDSQVKFIQNLAEELKSYGVLDVTISKKSGYVTGKINSNVDQKVPVIGLLSHVDTADFNAENVNPQIIKDYDGKSPIKLGNSEFVLDPKVFPSLKKYQNQTLITTDGTTLLGADDKAGVTEIMTFVEYLHDHPEVKHGEIWVGFGPDEEIGTGADQFEADKFPVDFAYTVDGGPVGQLEYETFNAAGLTVKTQGVAVHTSEAKGKLISALQLAIDFQNQMPADQRADTTEGREGFSQLMTMSGDIENAQMEYILRDFEKEGLEERKETAQKIAAKLNQEFGADRVVVDIVDQYQNMYEIIKDHMEVVDLVRAAMKALDITPDEEAVRGGTDGSKISFMGIPTPNIFAGGENMHGRYEYVALESMTLVVDLLLKMNEINLKAVK